MKYIKTMAMLAVTCCFESDGMLIRSASIPSPFCNTCLSVGARSLSTVTKQSSSTDVPSFPQFSRPFFKINKESLLDACVKTRDACVKVTATSALLATGALQLVSAMGMGVPLFGLQEKSRDKDS